MKILGFIVLAIFLICGYFGKRISDKAFEKCMEAGVQSEETCWLHAYQ